MLEKWILTYSINETAANEILIELPIPNSTVVGRSYTDRGELYQLTHASTTIDTRTYDNGGRMTASAYNNGVSESRTYNTDNTLTGISYTGAAIGNMTYGWDNNKNKTAETIAGTMSGYGFSIPGSGYDNEDRLVTYNRTDTNLDQSWSLSAVGDWNSITTEGTAQTRTHGPTHELLTGGGGTVTTDVKGNITLIPSQLRPNSASLLLNWDADNRLNTADVGNNSSIDVTYKFDALGRRVFRDDGTTANVYVQSGQQTIADYVSGTVPGSPTYRYVYASYIDEPVLRYKPTGSESLYYHRNQQFSITALTSASGTILERYAYTAYGVPTITNATGTLRTTSLYDNRYTYTGREWDKDLQLYHYRARMYDASLGRFCSKDPIGYFGSPWSMYEYVLSSPVGFTDPRGECAVKCCCCAESISIKNIKRVDDRRRWGTAFDTEIGLSYIQHDKEIDCTLEWWEKNDNASRGRPANVWIDLMKTRAGRLSPTLGPWFPLTPGSKFAGEPRYRPRQKPCPGSESVTLPDIPSLGKARGRNATRTLTFLIKVKSAKGCPCKKSEVWVTARQKLEMKNGVGVKEEFSTPAVPFRH